MEVIEVIYTFLKANLGITLIGAFTLIQISPIKINPWSWIAKLIHGFLFAEIDKKLVSIESKIDRVESTIEEREAVLARTHVLRFNDELLNSIHHTNEYFLQTFDDIKTYDKYCAKNPSFANGRTTQAAENIKRTYEILFDQHKI